MPFRYLLFSESLRCKRNLKKCHLHKAQAHIRKSKQTCLDNWLFAVLSALMALAKFTSLVDQSCSHCTIQSYMTQIDWGVLRKMEQNHHNTHQSLYQRKKAYNQLFALTNILNICQLQRFSIRETDCIMFDSSKMSPEKVCLDLKFPYLGFNSQSYLQESASSNFLIESAWLEICPSAII